MSSKRTFHLELNSYIPQIGRLAIHRLLLILYKSTKYIFLSTFIKILNSYSFLIIKLYYSLSFAFIKLN